MQKELSSMRIILIDDHPLVLNGLVSVLSLEPDIEIIGEANNVEDALGVIKERHPDIALLDIRLGNENGLEIISRIKEESGFNVRTIDGITEANIIRRTNKIGFEHPDNLSMYIDVGGGSTDISIMDGERVIDVKSFKIGTLRILSKKMDKKELIGKGESQNLEFKESLKLKEEIGETVSAFSNSDGGTVIVGVSDSSSELRKLAKESGDRVYCDERVCEEVNLEDIDEEKIRQFLRKAKYERKLEIDPDILVKEALKRLSLIKYEADKSIKADG